MGTNPVVPRLIALAAATALAIGLFFCFACASIWYSGAEGDSGWGALLLASSGALFIAALLEGLCLRRLVAVSAWDLLLLPSWIPWALGGFGEVSAEPLIVLSIPALAGLALGLFPFPTRRSRAKTGHVTFRDTPH